MAQFLDYHGSNWIVVSRGTLNTDLYGLDTATAIWKAPQDNLWAGDPLNTPHPTWSWLQMEKRKIDVQPGFLIITGDYAGVRYDTPYVYEASYGTCQEPIQTHPSFGAFAGTPSSPANNAKFVDVETGKLSTDDNRAVFQEFGKGLFAGVTDYLASQITVRQTWCSRQPVNGSNIPIIQDPPVAASVPTDVGWLLIGCGFQQRGSAFVNFKEWRSSGYRGWNSAIY